MSTDFSIKPIGAPAAAPVVLSTDTAAEEGVATQLPPSRSVTPANGAAAPGTGASSDSTDTARAAYIDRSSGAVVLQVVNSFTRVVVEQYPDEASLRARAYSRALENAREASRDVVTDRSI